MMYVEARSILSAVKKVYSRLFPSGLTPFDRDLQREVCATIIIEPGTARAKEAVSVSGDLLSYNYKYEKFFPYAQEIPDTGGDIISFEMSFWNRDLMAPHEDAPEGRLQRVINLLRSAP